LFRGKKGNFDPLGEKFLEEKKKGKSNVGKREEIPSIVGRMGKRLRPGVSQKGGKKMIHLQEKGLHVKDY